MCVILFMKGSEKMKCINDLTHKELKKLIFNLIGDSAEVQGESEEDFLRDFYNLKFYDDSKEFSSYDVDELIRKVVDEHLPRYEECDCGSNGAYEYFVAFIDYETDDSFEITYSMTEDTVILSDIKGDEPLINTDNKILEDVIIPKINAIFQ